MYAVLYSYTIINISQAGYSTLLYTRAKNMDGTVLGNLYVEVAKRKKLGQKWSTPVWFEHTLPKERAFYGVYSSEIHPKITP